jgi:hypothetical protein
MRQDAVQAVEHLLVGGGVLLHSGNRGAERVQGVSRGRIADGRLDRAGVRSPGAAASRDLNNQSSERRGPNPSEM